MDQPDALILTGIGIGTAFTVLILLLISVLIIRLVARLINKDEQEETLVEDSEMRNRAVAAAVAVTALMESRPHLRNRTTQNRND